MVALTADWSWSCSVDGILLKMRFERESVAWEAGVREASRLDGTVLGADASPSVETVD